MGCGCGAKSAPDTLPKSLLTSSGNFTAESLAQSITPENERQMVEVEYIGPIREDFTVKSRIDMRIHYRFGNNDENRSRAVYLADAEFLIGQTDRYGSPIYKIITAGAAMESRDPTAFLGTPLETA